MSDLLLFTPLDDFALTQYEFVPLGLLCLASYVENSGYEADVLHGRTSDLKSGYKFYGVSATSGQYEMAKKALARIREIEPSAKVILGGPHLNARRCVEECCNDGWDFLVVGEGERALVDILKGKTISDVVNGIPIEDLNSLPFPAYHKIDMTKYNYPLQDGLRCINLIVSRGCPFSCAFCSGSGTRLRQKSVENVLLEVDLLVNKYGFTGLTFVDDTMSINRNRYHSILSGLEQFNVKWKAHARTSTISFEGLERMARSGCIECSPGIESGDQELLDIVHKKTKVEHNLEWCKKCEEAGITCSPFVLIGLPNESLETIRKTREFIEQSKVSAFSYNILMPFPDSPLVLDYEQYKKYITIYPYTWEDCITKSKKIKKCFISTPFLTREQILKEYYKNYDLFSEITRYDPRKRGNRGK